MPHKVIIARSVITLLQFNLLFLCLYGIAELAGGTFFKTLHFMLLMNGVFLVVVLPFLVYQELRRFDGPLRRDGK